MVRLLVCIPLVVWFAYCVLFYFHVATLEINATGVVFGEDLSEKDESLFL